MMALARAEARVAAGEPCASVAHAEADVWRTLDAADRSRTAMALHGQDAASTVPAAMVETAVRNLLDNALRYSPPASVVELELMVHPAAQTVVVTVSDSGRGLRTEQMAQAGTRFWWGDRGRRVGEGSGLGLSIVHAIAQQFHGTLQLAPRPGGGLAATLTLPMARTAATP